MAGKKKEAEVVSLNPAATQFTTSSTMTAELLVRKWIERGHKLPKGTSPDSVIATCADVLRSLGSADAMLVITLQPEQQDPSGRPVYRLEHQFIGPKIVELIGQMTASIPAVYGKMSEMTLTMRGEAQRRAAKMPATKKKPAAKKKRTAKKR